MKYVLTMAAVLMMFTSCAHKSHGGCGCGDKGAAHEHKTGHDCGSEKSKDSKKTDEHKCEECEKSEKASK